MGSREPLSSYPVDGISLLRGMRVMSLPPIWVPGLPPPFGITGFIEAYCVLVTTYAWIDGTAYTQVFAEGIALTPPQEAGPNTRTGFQANFHLDTVWLPRAARILDLGGTHEMIIDRRWDNTDTGSAQPPREP